MLTENKSILKDKDSDTECHTIVASGIVSIYLSIVVYMSIWDTLQYIFFIPIIFALSYLAMLGIIRKAKILYPQFHEKSALLSDAHLFMLLFFIVFSGQLIYWFAYYPGGFNLDAYGQWDQVHGLMKLNNWHPVFTTGCYWLLTRIYDSFSFCIFAQLLAFSLSIAYLLLVLSHLKISKVLLIITAIYITFNPAIGMNNICLFKDVLFTIALIWMIIICVQIVETNGNWLKSDLHIMYLTFELVIISLIRHNGVFIIVPVIVCMAFIFKRDIKRILTIALCCLFFLLIIQGSLFSALSVEKHSNFTGEAIGVPMAILANNFIEDYEHTPNEVREFLLSIADESEWKEKYILGEWDSCKWDFGGIELFKNEPLSKFIRLAWLSTCESPDTAYQSVRENTKVVWQVWGFAEWNTWIYIEENDYGITPTPNAICNRISEKILDISLTAPGTLLFWNIGVPNAILMLMIVIVVARKKYKKLIYILPFIAYNLLTMMLLCGPSHRYFYFNSVLIFPVMLLVLNVTPIHCVEVKQ